MKTFILMVGVFFGSSGVVLAESNVGEVGPMDHRATHPQGFPIVKGLIRRIDTVNMQLSIKHDAIPNLGMPAMTMSFAVKDPSMLDGLSPGSRVLFSADEAGGVLTVIWIERAP